MKISWCRALVTALIFLCGMGAAAGAATMTVEVSKVVGKVEMLSPAEWKVLADGDRVPVGAEVRTGAGASCMLKWAGGNVASLQQFTVLKVAEADASETGAERTTLDLKEGKIYAHAKKLSTRGSKFNVKTPTAVAGVRGTDFFAEAAEGRSNFAVGEGNIQIEAGGGEMIVLGGGLFVSVDESGAISEPVPIPAEIVSEAKEKFDEVKNEGKQEEEKTLKEEKEGKKEEKKEGAKEEKPEKEKVKEEKEAGKEPEEKPGEAKEEPAGEAAGETKETDAVETSAGGETEVGAEIADTEVVVEPEIAVSVDDVIATVTDQVLDNQTTSDIITAAEELIESGTVRVIVNIESQ